MKNKYIIINRGRILDHPILRNIYSYYIDKKETCIACNVRSKSDLYFLFNEKIDKKTIIIIGDPIAGLIATILRPTIISKSIFFSFEMYGYQTPNSSILRLIKNTIHKISHLTICRLLPKVVFSNSLRKEFYSQRWKFIEKKSSVFENYHRNNELLLDKNSLMIDTKNRIDNFRKKYSKIICYVGLIQPGRDIELIIDAVKDTDIGLILAGKDDLNITEKAEKSKNICYLGKISQVEAYYVYENSDWGYLNYDNNILNTRFCAPVKVYEYLYFNLNIISNNNVALLEKNRFINLYYTSSEELNNIILGLETTNKITIDLKDIDFDSNFNQLMQTIIPLRN